MYSNLTQAVRSTIRYSPNAWARACRIHLRPYQARIARAIKDSIINHRSLTFVVILPRQSGKNELQAHIFAWLLFRYARTGGRIVSVSPTFKPQTILNMNRVAYSLNACIGSRGLWKSTSGYIYRLGQACLQFYSGESRAKVVGATADLLLSVDEAQEVSLAKFDKDFDPMTASTNATRIFWGIPWASNNLLDRERRIALQAQQKDGIQRLFYFTADDIRKLVPAYGLHVDRVIAEHGRDHPRVRSQYFCETIDAQSGMFTPARLSLLIAPLPKCVLPFGEGLGVGQGSGEGLGSPLSREAPCLHPSGGKGKCVLPPAPAMGGFGDRGAHRTLVVSRSVAEGGPGVGSPLPREAPCLHPSGCKGRFFLQSGEGPGVGHTYSFLLDIAGMDESRINPGSDLGLGNPGRDSTALTIVEIDLSTLETLSHPTYHVVARHSWVGENHLTVFGKLKSLAETWQPQHIVIDATGVGEGLWALLDRAFPTRLIPVKFTQKEKSEIGWRFISIIETGRFRDHCHTDQVRLQYSHCISEILPGPAKTLRWGVPDGTRCPDGELIHDDFILADSLTAKLDLLEWHISTPTSIIPGRDPLLDIDHHTKDDDYDHFFGDRENIHYFK